MTTPNEELRKQLQQIYKSGELDYRVISDAADLLQSQAERIKELELLVKVKNKPICDYQELIAERDTLRAQLAALDATAPYAYTHNHEWKLRQSESVIKMVKSFQPEYGFTFPLFTRPMPAQGVEASMIELPEPDDTYCGVNYYTEAQLKQAVSDAQDVNAELVEALQLFAYALPLDKSTVKTCYAVNNQMRDAAHAALSKYKGAK